ncbi:MAG: BspA family leucine-rich repeat surface protein, partial [Erysipelotrichaceae bacterium]|nr:BspA family leucine-rich repeat surface protein [Erysipelotrichaceae bacterium]
MKHKKVAKLGIVFALAISILTNSVGNMFAQQEEQIEEVTTEDYESEIESKVKNEIKEERVAVEEEKEGTSKTETLPIENKEAVKEQEGQSSMYTLSKSKFYEIHAMGPEDENEIPVYERVMFIDGPLPVGVEEVDLSENGDGSVIGGIDGEGRQKRLIVTTNTPGQKVKFPDDSSYLFVRFLGNIPDDNNISSVNRKYIDLSNVDTSEVTNMKAMFAGVMELTQLDLSNFNTANVNNMDRMFFRCNDLEEVDLSSFNTERVVSMTEMFAGGKYTTLDLSMFNTWLVTSMMGMFEGCRYLTTLDLSNFSVSRVLSMDSMFEDCRSLTTLDLSNFNTNIVSQMRRMFYGCKSLTSLNLTNLFKTSNVKYMNSMFEGCSSLETLDLRNFDTRKVQNMFSMFKDCSALTTLDVSSFDTSNVTTMRWMFHSCSSLQSLNLGASFNTMNVQEMTAMFYRCNSLQSLDLTTFNTSNVTNMAAMFQECSSLTELDLSHFDTSNVTRMASMFKDCSSLVTLDLANFSTSNVDATESMFQNCSSLTTIYSEEWDISKVTSDIDMFLGCEQVVGKSEYAITTPFDPNRIGKEVATPNNGYFTVPNLEEWNATVKYVDEDNQVLATKDFLATNRKPEITTENLNEFMPNGYELVDENSSLTVTQDGQVFEVEIRKIQWTLELEYQTLDGTVVKTEAIQVIQLNPVVPAQTITEKVPVGYELAEEVNDWTAAANGEKKVIQVREIQWTVNLEYQTEDGTVVKTESIHVTQLNPVVTAQMITEKVPAGYELVDTAADWTATANGEKKVIQVREVEWTVNLEYQTADGTVVKTEAIQVTQLNPVVSAQMISEKVPTGYELVEEVTDWTAAANGDKKVIQVRAIEWIVSLEYQTADGTVVKTEAIQVTQLNPVVPAQVITEKVPVGYELIDLASDWTATSNGDKKVIQVREVEWAVSLEYRTVDGTTVKTEAIQVTQLNPVVTAQMISEKVPTGYELIDPATDWTATTNGEKKIVQVREVEWTVSLEYQIEDGTVIKEEQIQVTQLNPVISAQTISEKVPTGYELAEEVSDWTVTANGDKKVIQVRAIEWIVSLEYQTADGNVVKTEAIQVTQLNPVVSAQVITEKVPTGYELAEQVSDWTAASNGDKKVIQVRAIEWIVSLEYQTLDGTVVKEEQIQVTQLNPIVTAQTISEKVPTGYELIDPATDWTATSNGEKKVIQVREVEWTVSLEYQTVDGTVIKTEAIQVTQLNPVVTAQMITDGVPTGYELVEQVSDWTATMNEDKHVVKVREIEWAITIEFITENARGIVETVTFTVGNLNPVIEAQQIMDAIPAGYYAVNEIQDLRATRDGEVFQITVEKIESREGIVHFVDQNGVTVKTEVYSVTNKDPMIRVEELEKALPIGAILVNSLTELT